MSDVDEVAEAVHYIMSRPNPFSGTDGYDEAIRRILDEPIPPLDFDTHGRGKS